MFTSSWVGKGTVWVFRGCGTDHIDCDEVDFTAGTPDHAPAWFQGRRVDCRFMKWMEKFRTGGYFFRLRRCDDGGRHTVIDTFCSALCGVFVTLGIFSFSTPAAVLENWISLASAAAVFLFLLVAAAGIFQQPSSTPKYAFALAQIITVLWCPPWCVPVAMLMFYIPLFALLVLRAQWRGARFAVLPLSMIFAWGTTSEYREEKRLPEASYLPVSLLPEHRGARILGFGSDIPENWWKALPYISMVDCADSPGKVRKMDRRGEHYDLAVAAGVGSSGRRGFRRELYRWMSGRLAPAGILVIPSSEVDLLPAAKWRFAPLPGGGGSWLAARDGMPPSVNPELMDRRLQDFLRDEPMESRLLLPGVLPALYPAPDSEEIFISLPSAPVEKRSWREMWPWWSGACLLWLLLRLTGCRRERAAVTAAGCENLASMTLYTLASIPLWEAGELFTGISPRMLAAGIGLLLLPTAVGTQWRRWIVLSGIPVALLPLLPSLSWFFLPACCWCFWMLTGSVTLHGLLEDDRRGAFRGSVSGVAAGVVLFLLLQHSGIEVFPAAAVTAAMLRLGVLLRR